MTGETKMKMTVLRMPPKTSEPVPAFTSAAPIIPPISAWEELVGRPKYQVKTSQTHAPASVPKMTPLSTIVMSMIPLPMVFAT